MANSTGAIPVALQQFDQLPNAAFVRAQTVAALFGCSVPTVWRWAKTGRLSRPRKLSENVTAWNVGELRQRLAK